MLSGVLRTPFFIVVLVMFNPKISPQAPIHVNPRIMTSVALFNALGFERDLMLVHKSNYIVNYFMRIPLLNRHIYNQKCPVGHVPTVNFLCDLA